MGKKIVDTSWDFKGVDTKYLTHGFHSYPAMMIPQIAKRLIGEYIKDGGVILDPFSGSGTSLVESMIMNKKSYGIDINPLTKLVAKTKTTPIYPTLLKREIENILKKTERDLIDIEKNKKEVETKDFPNINYWFKPDVIKKLTVIKTNIDKIKNDKNKKDIYDFFLVTFSETVRKVSNTRGSEFKLYRIPEDKLKTYNPDVLEIFRKNLMDRLESMEVFFKEYGKNTKPTIMYADSRKKLKLPEKIDLVVTSPPYGDSKTTVAYGQFSRLSLQWLDMYDNDVIKDIDKMSLGGIPVKKINFNTNSISLNRTLIEVEKKSLKRAREVASFYLDLEKCLENLSLVMKKNGHMCFVVGNRTVKGLRMPTDMILTELAESVGFTHVKTIIRNIPSKKMPSKNSPTNVKGVKGQTMSKECIVILKKN